MDLEEKNMTEYEFRKKEMINDGGFMSDAYIHVETTNKDFLDYMDKAIDKAIMEYNKNE